MLVHRAAGAVDVPRSDRKVDAAMHVSRVAEVAVGCALGRLTPLFIEHARDHVDERCDDRIARRRCDDTMEVDVVDEKDLRRVERAKQTVDFLGEGGNLVRRGALCSERRRFALENAARFVHLAVRDAMEGGQKTERFASERRRSGRYERAGAMPRLHHSDCRKGAQPGAHGWTADPDVERQVALGGQPVSGLERTTLDQRADVRHHLLGAVFRGRRSLRAHHASHA
jgi:hypothetical protein